MPGPNVICVNVLYHPKSQFGSNLFRELLTKLYQKDTIDLEMDLKVPVFSIPYKSSNRVLPTFNPEEWKKYDHHFILIVLDSAFIGDSSNISFLKFLIEFENANSNTKLIPVTNEINIPDSSQTNLFSVTNILRPLGLLRSNNIGIQESIDSITSITLIEIFHLIAKRFINQNLVTPINKITLFLSHTKRGGIEITTKIRRFIQEVTQLNKFMDLYDIQVGEFFESEIQDWIKKPETIFLTILTDHYSSRPVCKMEVLYAKKNQRPILTINAITNSEKRSFPYLNNTPVVKWFDTPYGIAQIIELALREFLRMTIVAKEMSNFIDETKTLVYKHLFFPPELLTICNLLEISKNVSNMVVVYPAPAIDEQENELLLNISPNIKFITPWQIA